MGNNGKERLDWDAVPNYPSSSSTNNNKLRRKRKMNGAMIHVVNDKKGALKSLNENSLREISSMESVLDMEIYPEYLDVVSSSSNIIEPTIDIKTDAGWIQLVHPNEQIFQRDYERIMELMPTLFGV